MPCVASSSARVSVPSRERLELGPERLLLTAAAAPDLHYTAAETLRSTAHSVVAFAWNGTTALPAAQANLFDDEFGGVAGPLPAAPTNLSITVQ